MIRLVTPFTVIQNRRAVQQDPQKTLMASQKVGCTTDMAVFGRHYAYIPVYDVVKRPDYLKLSRLSYLFDIKKTLKSQVIVTPT